MLVHSGFGAINRFQTQLFRGSLSIFDKGRQMFANRHSGGDIISGYYACTVLLHWPTAEHFISDIFVIS